MPLPARCESYTSKLPIHSRQQRRDVYLGNIDIHFMNATNSRYFSTINNWQAYLNCKLIVYAALSCASIH